MLSISHAWNRIRSEPMPASLTDLSQRLREVRELRRLGTLPRHTPTTTKLLGPTLKLVDGPSFTSQYDALFRKQECKFRSSSRTPTVIDCGANVGVSCLYWKSLYPGARITAFEPDPTIYATLKANLEAFGYSDVVALQKAAWIENTQLEFWSEGADGGRISDLVNTKKDLVKVDAVRLRDFLDQEIDLLKIDIEGAEIDVVRDCADALGSVKHICVEYHSFTGRAQRLDELMVALAQAGFRLQLRAELASTQPFVHSLSHSGMDLQLQVFGVRAEQSAS